MRTSAFEYFLSIVLGWAPIIIGLAIASHYHMSDGATVLTLGAALMVSNQLRQK